MAYLHVLSDQPDPILSDGDPIELDNVTIAGGKLQDADLREEGFLRLLVALVQHLNGNLLHMFQRSSTDLSLILKAPSRLWKMGPAGAPGFFQLGSF